MPPKRGRPPKKVARTKKSKKEVVEEISEDDARSQNIVVLNSNEKFEQPHLERLDHFDTLSTLVMYFDTSVEGKETMTFFDIPNHAITEYELKMLKCLNGIVNNGNINSAIYFDPIYYLLFGDKKKRLIGKWMKYQRIDKENDWLLPAESNVRRVFMFGKTLEVISSEVETEIDEPVGAEVVNKDGQLHVVDKKIGLDWPIGIDKPLSKLSSLISGEQVEARSLYGGPVTCSFPTVPYFGGNAPLNNEDQGAMAKRILANCENINTLADFNNHWKKLDKPSQL